MSNSQIPILNDSKKDLLKIADKDYRNWIINQLQNRRNEGYWTARR